MNNATLEIPTERKLMSLMTKGAYFPSAAIAVGMALDQSFLNNANAAPISHIDYMICVNYDQLVAINLNAVISKIGKAQVEVETSPQASVDTELETIFNGLAKNWREATGGYSLTMRRYAHPSYQSILALEPKKEVIALILLELQVRPDRWFEALKALTKYNAAADSKSFDETVKCWLKWGKSEKYIS